MNAMQLSLDLDTDRDVVVAPTPRARRTARPSLAACVAAVHAAQDPDTHAHAVDAVLTAATSRITRIARLFLPSWPVAHVDVDDLTQEALLEVAASLTQAPHVSDGHTHAWLSALVMQVLHDLWRVAVRDAVDHREALAAFAVERQSDASVPHLAGAGEADDEHMNPPNYPRAA